MADTVFDKLMKDKEFKKYYQREELMSEITLATYQIMTKKNITQKKLAEMAGVSRGRISQILSGNYNITVATVSDLLYSLDSKLTISVEPIDVQGYEAETLKDNPWIISQRPDEAAGDKQTKLVAA